MNQKKYEKFKRIASEISLVNPRQKKHVSIIFSGNRIISVGINQHKSHPKAKEIGYRFDEVHSELDALLKCRQRKNIELFNFRFNRFGEQRISRPCCLCAPWCKMIFNKIYFTNDTYSYERMDY